MSSLRPHSFRSPFVPSLLVALVVAACAEDPTLSGPDISPSVATQSALDDLVDDLFPPGGQKNAAERRIRNIRRQYDRGQTEAAEEMMFDLVAWVLERQDQSQLMDPNGGAPPTTEEAVSELVGELFSSVSLTPPQVPPEALAPGGTAQIVDETGGEVAPDDPIVGLQIPPGAFSGPTLVWIAPLSPASPPLPTGLTQFLPYYEIDASSQPTSDVVIGICYLDDPPDAGGVPVGFPQSRLRIAHPDPANSQVIEILPTAPVPSFLDCAPGASPNVSPAEASVLPLLDWAGRRLVRTVSTLFGTRPAATSVAMAHRGLGGSLRSFSPFAVVDIQSGGSISAVSGDAQVEPNGTTLPNPVVIEVLDAVGLPMPGVTVDFAVPGPYGTGIDGTFAPTSAVTNASGRAQASWTISNGGEVNWGTASVNGFAAAPAFLTACGSFVGQSLGASALSVDPQTGDVVIGGGDSRRPISNPPPFNFDWGDGSSTDAYFNASHTYANTSQNYTVTVTATYCDGTTDQVAVPVDFIGAITWSTIPNPSGGGRLTGVWGTDENNFWVSGENGVLLRTTDGGATWTSQTPAAYAALHFSDIWTPDGQNLWIAADDRAGGGGGFLIQPILYSGDGGATWTLQYSNGLDQFGGLPNFSVWGSSTTDIWVGSCCSAVLHYDGQTWSTINSPAGFVTLFPDVWASTPQDIFAAGSGQGIAVSSDGGTTWTAASLPAGRYEAIWGAGTSDVYAVGIQPGNQGGHIVHYDGNGWQTDLTTAEFLLDVWGTGTSDVVAIGFSGAVYHEDGSGWAIQPTGTAANLLGVWVAPGPTGDIFVVGDGGTILRGSR